MATEYFVRDDASRCYFFRNFRTFVVMLCHLVTILYPKYCYLPLSRYHLVVVVVVVVVAFVVGTIDIVVVVVVDLVAEIAFVDSNAANFDS